MNIETFEKMINKNPYDRNLLKLFEGYIYMLGDDGDKYIDEQLNLKQGSYFLQARRLIRGESKRGVYTNSKQQLMTWYPELEKVIHELNVPTVTDTLDDARDDDIKYTDKESLNRISLDEFMNYCNHYHFFDIRKSFEVQEILRMLDGIFDYVLFDLDRIQNYCYWDVFSYLYYQGITIYRENEQYIWSPIKRVTQNGTAYKTWDFIWRPLKL